jgi:hypothetical protein
MSRYIDADELLKRLPDNLPYKASVKRALIQAPTADVVEVRHGYWLSAYEYSLKFDISEERRNEVKNDRIWKFCCLCDQAAKWDYDYCPNCGAKMDGERREK